MKDSPVSFFRGNNRFPRQNRERFSIKCLFSRVYLPLTLILKRVGRQGEGIWNPFPTDNPKCEVFLKTPEEFKREEFLNFRKSGLGVYLFLASILERVGRRGWGRIWNPFPTDNPKCEVFRKTPEEFKRERVFSISGNWVRRVGRHGVGWIRNPFPTDNPKCEVFRKPPEEFKREAFSQFQEIGFGGRNQTLSEVGEIVFARCCRSLSSPESLQQWLEIHI
ncbi:hypothetical protein CEXT_451131 [Caerostris extrusa]|uniref:Uncharacterized protein n=1 Tax=Caerostris extrusa TaxID=172846 RepID=A0AAV4Y3D2_CAEEX|nr:hypothetical protein CEXT_451131 [Caerostris extrusa]